MKSRLFEKIGVIKTLADAVGELGFDEPTPIQQRAIPLILSKKDIFATAQTGTGKTAAFMLPLLQRLKKHNPKNPRALVLSPTRELCLQIYEDTLSYAKYLDINIAVIIGGKDLENQKKALKSGVDIIIATPGRALEHTQKGLKLDNIEIFVIDEADRMLDMGFSKDIKSVAQLLPKRHQTLFFSATYSTKVRNLSKLLLTKPEFLEVAKKNITAEGINQIAYLVDKENKAPLLAYIIGSRNYHQVLVFTRTKASADELIVELKKDGLKSGVIHGDKTQASRSKTLAEFKEGKLRVLVATDIASRGLDIEDLPIVINYELPLIPEDYVHRVGRTGRAGKDGVAISLIDIDEKFEIKRIERLISKKIPKDEIEGFGMKQIRREDKKEIIPKSEYKPEKKRRK
ncbi:MAG: DEAD/DEAH box helicase [Sulfurimonadaceae bacterium]|nr:DEAD/DEAH box helicase [Sulfurimonadaceae bacterium]